MDKIKVLEKFELFSDLWSPKIIGRLNGQDVKLAKVHGDFVWHNHENEDELFFVIRGMLKIEFRDQTITLNEGEMLIVPKGVDHKPVAEDETWLMLFEPCSIKHRGNVSDELTIDEFDFI